MTSVRKHLQSLFGLEMWKALAVILAGLLVRRSLGRIIGEGMIIRVMGENLVVLIL